MRKIKILVSVLISVALILSLFVPAMAATGTITVGNAYDGKEYKLYRILDIESAAGNKATYKANSNWENFLKTATFDKAGMPTNFAIISSDGYVTFASDAPIKEFAKQAIAYAETNTIAPIATKTKAVGETLTFEGLALGYYLLNTTTGTVCSLDSLTTSLTIQDKNTIPELNKTVQEDSTKVYGEKNNAQIGETVYFRAAIKACYGAENYVMKDTMSAGLTFDSSSVKVYNYGTTLPSSTGDLDAYKLVASSNYSVTSGGGGVTFSVAFEQTYLDGIGTDPGDYEYLIVAYSATVNENAEIDTENTNEAKLVYGNNHETVTSKTKTFVYDFKLAKTDKSDAGITGAEFELYDIDGNQINLVKAGEVYRVATDDDDPANYTIIEAGEARITGLDAGSYKLVETKAPDGYNKLSDPVVFSIDDDGIVMYSGSSTETVKVVNVAGAILPETGGTGTKVLFAVGGVLVVVAFVLFTSKRRMSAEG